MAEKRIKAKEIIKEGEIGIQSSILEYLAIKHHIFWRQNTTAVYDTNIKCYRKKSVYARNGVSDIIVLYKNTAWFLEVKSKTGKQDPDQIVFERDVIKAGCHYAVVRSLEDVINLGL